jgi:hypothetical protein
VLPQKGNPRKLGLLNYSQAVGFPNYWTRHVSESCVLSITAPHEKSNAVVTFFGLQIRRLPTAK